MEGFLERRWGPIFIGCVETPPARLLVYRLTGCPWLYLRAAQPLNDKPMCSIDYYRTIVRGCVDPREKSDIVSGSSGFLKRAQDSISSHGGVALVSEPQPISGKRIWLEFHVVRSGVDTGGHRYIVPAFLKL